MKKIILPTAYFPSISWSVLYMNSADVFMEACEHWIKQSTRNRCYIAGANGPLMLIVPVRHYGDKKILVRDVEICNDTHWQKIHWKSFESAYRNSPYFEMFEDLLLPYFEKKYRWLFELNRELLEAITGFMKINKPIALTNQYLDKYDGVAVDYRKFAFDKDIKMPHYQQVFESRNGFFPNLSLIDLLFNTGLHSISYLRQSNLSGIT